MLPRRKQSVVFMHWARGSGVWGTCEEEVTITERGFKDESEFSGQV